MKDLTSYKVNKNTTYQISNGSFDNSNGSLEKSNEFDKVDTETGIHKKLNVFKGMLFVAGENAGGGLLALPFVLKECGWSGALVIGIFGLAAAYAGLKLAKTWLILEDRYEELRGHFRYPYPAIGLKAFGPKMRFIVTFCVQTTMFGSCVVVLLLCSEIVYNVAKDAVGICFCNWILIIAAVLCPLMWFGTPGEFWPAAAGAIGTTSIAVVLIIWEITNDLIKNLESDDIQYSTPTIKTYFLAFGTVMFAYGGTAGFPTFQNDMKHKNKFKYSLILGFIILLVLYIPTSTLGYLTYGNTVKNNIFLSLTNDSIQKLIAQLLIAGHLFFAFLLLANPPAQEIEDFIGIPKNFNWKRVALRVSFLIIIVFIAETVPLFGKLLNLIGGSSIAMLSFILPPLFYLKICSMDNPCWHKIVVTLKEKIILGLITIIGIIAGVACTYSALIEIFSPSAFTMPCYINSSFVPFV